MIALLGPLFGALSALIPHLLKLWTDKEDRKHELAILQLQLQAQKETSQAHLEEIRVNSDTAFDMKQIDMPMFKPTGIEWVDALNGTVRPMLSYGMATAWFLIKAAHCYLLLSRNEPAFLFADIMWNEYDQSLLYGVMTHYFTQRGLQKKG